MRTTIEKLIQNCDCIETLLRIRREVDARIRHLMSRADADAIHAEAMEINIELRVSAGD